MTTRRTIAATAAILLIGTGAIAAGATAAQAREGSHPGHGPGLGLGVGIGHGDRVGQGQTLDRWPRCNRSWGSR